ncbi:MAG TPA: cytochrome c biogenesis protein CcdA [Streptosporangiaceae bacterium]|nr:cytochrome c biogenesis protein CcdA [Streptosporangiaceae bacterium]
MIGGIEHLVESGPLLLAMPVAAAAGAVTFLSPCCLPLVPGYLAYLTGMSGTAVQREDADSPARAASPAETSTAATVTSRTSTAGTASAGTASVSAVGTMPFSSASSGSASESAGSASARSRAVLGTLLFVLGFSAVFATEGVFFGTLGEVLRNHTRGLDQVLGCIIILLGLLFVGAFDRFSFSGRIFRPQFRPRAGLAGAPLLGVVFALGWTPCIGPTLIAVLSLGATTGTAGRGALLAFVYALGLGIPFLVVAFAFQRGASLFGFARRHARRVTQVGGVLLIAVGLLEVTGAWAAAVAWLQVHWFPGYNAPI